MKVGCMLCSSAIFFSEFYAVVLCSLLQSTDECTEVYTSVQNRHLKKPAARSASPGEPGAGYVIWYASGGKP